MGSEGEPLGWFHSSEGLLYVPQLVAPSRGCLGVPGGANRVSGPLNTPLFDVDHGTF